jgi:hypothetical protein
MLYWQATQDLFEDLTVSAQLLDAKGRLVAQRDGVPADGLNPTSLWLPHRLVVEQRDVNLPPDLAPGDYSWIVVLYRRENLKRLSATGGGSPLPDNAAVLGKVRVGP